MNTQYEPSISFQHILQMAEEGKTLKDLKELNNKYLELYGEWRKK